MDSSAKAVGLDRTCSSEICHTLLHRHPRLFDERVQCFPAYILAMERNGDAELKAVSVS